MWRERCVQDNVMRWNIQGWRQKKYWIKYGNKKVSKYGNNLKIKLYIIILSTLSQK